MLSAIMEDYLKAIYLQEESDSRVKTSTISSLSPVSSVHCYSYKRSAHGARDARRRRQPASSGLWVAYPVALGIGLQDVRR